MPKTKVTSPYAKWYNAQGLTPIRTFLKNKSATHHNTIIPPIENRGTLILGAIPTQAMLDRISMENSGLAVTRVSLLADDEESSTDYEVTQKSIHLSLFDHSSMDANTGTNMTLAEVQKKMGEVADGMNAGNVVYFHCMAGYTRSCFGVVIFLYLHPEFLKGVNGEFGEPPSLQEIASFVKKQRPEVTVLDDLKSEQKGLLGIVALNQYSEILQSQKAEDLNLDANKAKRIAQDIVFMLHAPLDRGFRDESDRTKQEENLAELYKIYKQAGHNLLLNMLPLGRFGQFSPSEQAHFAILAQSLVSRGVVTKEGLEADLGCPLSTLVQKATENHSKLTSGDQVELLRTFGSDVRFNFADVVAKIVAGNSIDRHNAGIQLAELLRVAKDNNLLPNDKKIIERFVDKLNTEEVRSFDNRLVQLGMEPKDFSKNCQNRVATQGRQVTKSALVQKMVEEEKSQGRMPNLPDM
ncbi:conserved hypothetical protein [Gammaproteobacteria bacterium]